MAKGVAMPHITYDVKSVPKAWFGLERSSAISLPKERKDGTLVVGRFVPPSVCRHD